MTAQELRDELMTLLVAGHETTASELAFTFERLVRTPAVLGRLTAEVTASDGDAYLTATVQEALFLDRQPGTYTWIPFGGGRRRCLGAAFATVEMKVVLRAVLERAQPRAAGDGRLELSRRRSITLSPREGAQVVLA